MSDTRQLQSNMGLISLSVLVQWQLSVWRLYSFI